jgi:hypothetical protein
MNSFCNLESSLLLGVVLQQVVGDELNRVGRPIEAIREKVFLPFLGSLREGLKEDGDNGLVKVGTDGQRLKGVILLSRCGGFLGRCGSLSRGVLGRRVRVYIPTLAWVLERQATYSSPKDLPDI